MPILRAGSKVVLFVHIPKTGGTSVEQWLRSVAPLSMYSPKRADFVPCVPQHFDAQIMKYLFDESLFDYSFAVVRNPYDRIISEFKYRNESKRYGLFVPSFKRWVRRNLAEYGKNNYLLSNHIRPQTDFLMPGVESFKIEDGFSHLQRRLQEVLGIAMTETVPHSNKSSDRPVEMDAGTMDIIYDFYRKDFEALGYSREYQLRQRVA